MTPRLRTRRIQPISCPSSLSVRLTDTQLHDGRLADLAPSLLALMGLSQPAAMTGRQLYRRTTV